MFSCNAAVLNEAAAPPPPKWNNGTYDVTIHYIAVDRRFSEPFYIHIICNFVPREYMPIYKRKQPLPLITPPRIYDVIIHYISVDRRFSVHFYVHFSFLRVCRGGGRFYCMYVPPSSTDAFQCPYRHRQALIHVLLPLYKGLLQQKSNFYKISLH